MCGSLDLPGLIFLQLVPWCWSRPNAASECDQSEPKRFGHIKQTCCFRACRLSAWCSHDGVSVPLIPTSGLTLCRWSQRLRKPTKLSAVASVKRFPFIFLLLLLHLIVPCCYTRSSCIALNETCKFRKVSRGSGTWTLPGFDLC